MVIPLNIEAEIVRHLADRAAEAVTALESARRKAPFLARWPNWPLKKDEAILKDELNAIAQGDYRRFKENFSIVMLDYKGVDIAEVMTWYEQARAPFGTGKKRKEFPDAVAIQALVSLARSEQLKIAVVSTDNDFRDACSFHNELVFFGSVAALTEALLGEEALVLQARSLVDRHQEEIIEAVGDRFPSLDFFPAANPDGKAADIFVERVTLANFSILEISKDEAKVAFDASISYSAWLNFMELSSLRRSGDGTPYYLHARTGTVHDAITIPGTIDLCLWADDPDTLDIVDVEFGVTECAVNGLPPIDDDW